MSKEGVTVGVRVRPLLPGESLQDECVRIQGGRVAVAGTHRLRHFNFPLLFDRTTPQQQVFQTFALPLLQDLFKGYSCCLLAYGQNRSGKTFTVSGGESQQLKGVIPRIVDHLVCKLHAEESSSRKIILRVSYIDICQEEIIDLLSIRKGVTVSVVEGPDHETTLRHVEMKTIGKPQDIQTQFILGSRKRELAYSKKYRSSQQSTSVFTLYLQSIEDGKIRKGKLDIVDMQASEVVLPYDPIPNNTIPPYDLSVNSFKNVVNALIYGNSQSVVPYNDSKVTQILRNALGGHTKARMLFHISPIIKCREATISTLRTASACQLIENTPTRLISDQSLIQQILDQLQQLTQQVQIVEEDIRANENNIQDKEKRKEIEKEEMGEGQNEFLSNSIVQRKHDEDRQDAQQKRLQHRQSLKKQIHNLNSLFLGVQPLKNKHQLVFFKENYTLALDRLAKSSQPLASPYESTENWNLSETSLRKITQKQRTYRQEVSDMQREFQQEREQMLAALRQVTQKYRFFQKVAERTVRPEEIEILKINARYDPTKRTYDMPLFSIRDKRVSHASRFFSPQQATLLNSRASSERRFLITQVGQRGKLTGIKQITSQNSLKDDPYLQRPSDPKPVRQSQHSGHRMSADEYELVRSSVMSNRLKRKTPRPVVHSPSDGSRSQRVKQIKPILSPRFRFK